MTRICSIDDCAKRSTARGWCRAHYARWRKYGDPLWRHPLRTCAIEDCGGQIPPTGRKPERYPVCEAHRGVLKVCVQCTLTKPLEEFHANGSTRDGHHPFCKTCRAAYTAAYTAAGLEEWTPDAVRTCPGCDTEKPHAEFFKTKSGRPSSWCRSCRLARDRRGYWAAPDKARERSRSYATDRRTAEWSRQQNLRKFGLTIEEYDDMADAQQNLCAVCHQPETITWRGGVRRLAVDHDHRTGAVRALLCARCNAAIGQANDDADRLEAMAAYVRRHAAT